MALVLLLFIVFITVALGVGSLAYLSARGLGKLAGGLPGTALPRSVRKSLQESRQYGRMIKQSLLQCPPGPLRDRLSLMVSPVEEWLVNLAQLERGLQKSYSQRNLPREVRNTVFRIEKTQQQLRLADDREVGTLRELLQSEKQHLVALQELQAFQSRAELKIRKITTDLGATHAEMVLIIAKGDFNENRLNRLDENLKEHVGGIRDMLSAMDELGYSSSVVN